MIRRIHTTYDLLEAHLITAILREHGIDALLFDADFVRQDWFKMIAYGGYRIVVRDDSVDQARALLRDYSEGNLALSDEYRTPCPNCAKLAGNDDPQPRRNIFLSIIVLDVVFVMALLFWKAPGTGTILVCFLACVTQIALILVLPWVAIRYFKWRSRCDACGYRWREPRRYRHAELAHMAESGNQAEPE